MTAESSWYLWCFPHIFIHYEGKLRIRQFPELCLHLIPDIDKSALTAAIPKYDEILSICEKCMQEMLSKTPGNAEEARAKRQAYIGILQRCRELEEEEKFDILFPRKAFCKIYLVILAVAEVFISSLGNGIFRASK